VLLNFNNKILLIGDVYNITLTQNTLQMLQDEVKRKNTRLREGNASSISGLKPKIRA